jgi:tol-pal system protein YbgF
MKCYSVRVLTALMALVASPGFVAALATVESRTGELPVFSDSSERTDFHGSAASTHAPTDSHAALLSLKQLEVLKQEISELRGLVETQDHEIQQLKKSQQDFYVDLDKRVNQVQASHKGQTAKIASKSAQIKPVSKTGITIVPTGTAAKKVEVQGEPDDEDAVDLAEVSHAAHPATEKTEKAVYDAAYDLVRTKHYSEATLAFQAYLTRFKDGEHAANAHYWMGEVYMVEWQKDQNNKSLLDKAAHAFSNIPSQFPTNPKVPDALLKLGIVESEKGNVTAAQKYFSDVKRRYPGTAAARIAETRLKQL